MLLTKLPNSGLANAEYSTLSSKLKGEISILIC